MICAPPPQPTPVCTLGFAAFSPPAPLTAQRGPAQGRHLPAESSVCPERRSCPKPGPCALLWVHVAPSLRQQEAAGSLGAPGWACGTTWLDSHISFLWMDFREITGRGWRELLSASNQPSVPLPQPPWGAHTLSPPPAVTGHPELPRASPKPWGLLWKGLPSACQGPGCTIQHPAVTFT